MSLRSRLKRLPQTIQTFMASFLISNYNDSQSDNELNLRSSRERDRSTYLNDSEIEIKKMADKENLFSKSASYRVIDRALDAKKLPSEDQINRYLKENSIDIMPQALHTRIDKLTEHLEKQAEAMYHAQIMKDRREALRAIQQDHEQIIPDNIKDRFFEEGAHATALANNMLQHLSWCHTILRNNCGRLGLPDVFDYLAKDYTLDFDTHLKLPRQFFFGDPNSKETNLLRSVDIAENDVKPYRLAYREKAKPPVSVDLLGDAFSGLRLVAVDEESAKIIRMLDEMPLLEKDVSVFSEEAKAKLLETQKKQAEEEKVDYDADYDPDGVMKVIDLEGTTRRETKSEKLAREDIEYKVQKHIYEVGVICRHNPWLYNGDTKEDREKSYNVKPQSFSEMAEDFGIRFEITAPKRSRSPSDKHPNSDQNKRQKTSDPQGKTMSPKGFGEGETLNFSAKYADVPEDLPDSQAISQPELLPKGLMQPMPFYRAPQQTMLPPLRNMTASIAPNTFNQSQMQPSFNMQDPHLNISRPPSRLSETPSDRQYSQYSHAWTRSNPDQNYSQNTFSTIPQFNPQVQYSQQFGGPNQLYSQQWNPQNQQYNPQAQQFNPQDQYNAMGYNWNTMPPPMYVRGEIVNPADPYKRDNDHQTARFINREEPSADNHGN